MTMASSVFQFFSFRRFCVIETEWGPEKVGKPTSVCALDPFQGDIRGER